MMKLTMLGVFTAMGISSAILVSCSGGGGSSQDDVLGISALKEQLEAGGYSHAGLLTGSPEDHNSGSHETLDAPVSAAQNSQHSSTIIYEPGQDQFLVVWNDLRNSSGSDYHGWAVYGQFMNGAGEFEGNNFPISSLGAEYRSAPVAAHDPATGQSIVAWETTGGDIIGQMINPDGTLSGNLIPIANSTADEGIPALVFDPIKGQYLAAWVQSGSDYPIYGQLITRDGLLHGNPFLISEISSAKLELKAVSDTVFGRFLVVWRDYRGVDIYSIRGQLVNSDGTLYNSEISIADTYGSQIAPDVAYDPTNRCFFVIWSDDRRFGGGHYEIYGQLLASDGMLITPNFLVSADGGHSHSVAFEPTNPHYLVAYSNSDSQIHGMYVAADGMLSDEPFQMSDMKSPQWAPDLAYNPQQQKFLTTWTDHRNGSTDIYGQTTILAVNSGNDSVSSETTEDDPVTTGDDSISSETTEDDPVTTGDDSGSSDDTNSCDREETILIDFRDETVFATAHNQASFSTVFDGREFLFEAKPEGAILWWDDKDGLGVQYANEADEIDGEEVLTLSISTTQFLKKVFITDLFNEGYLETGIYELNDDGDRVQFTAAPDQLSGSTNGELTLFINENVDSMAFSTPVNTPDQEDHEFSVAAIESISADRSSCLECDTVAAALVNGNCSVDTTYSTHGEYVECVANRVRQMREDGLIGVQCSLNLVSLAARSNIGKNP